MQEQVTAADLGNFLMEYAQSDVLVRPLSFWITIL